MAVYKLKLVSLKELAVRLHFECSTRLEMHCLHECCLTKRNRITHSVRQHIKQVYHRLWATTVGYVSNDSQVIQFSYVPLWRSLSYKTCSWKSVHISVAQKRTTDSTGSLRSLCIIQPADTGHDYIREKAGRSRVVTIIRMSNGTRQNSAKTCIGKREK